MMYLLPAQSTSRTAIISQMPPTGKTRTKRIRSDDTPSTSTNTSETVTAPGPIAKKRTISPQDLLLDITQGVIKPSLSLKGFFHIYTETEKDSYGNDICKAVRSLDMDLLKAMHRQGKTFQCSNRFGESLLHMACRRGSLEVVKFFLDIAGVSILCCDDFGRTPMHDACWSSAPNFELLELLIAKCPSLLLMCDKRGHSPLQYTRREHWSMWCNFLTKHKDLLSKIQV
eukprot:CAMPEP_0204615050 /NCGR_PEP_ID=MMETSP0717-20131115/2649_1 /ASSEMBLY_ACC=CAM_ASM_000666 /TAXON_ID=230516 /ORGANISM="Chaetoceros curvisetus" /LENGTH=227 /DNA_ID=CAMNT_0051627899 /DNA_START=36 /DNA_END=719 /DNA_ORIENTATION=+